MALTNIVRRTTQGDVRLSVMSATYTGTEETFDTGLQNVWYARGHFTAGDQTTSVYRNAETTTEGGSPGYVHITGISATDGAVYLIAIGT